MFNEHLHLFLKYLLIQNTIYFAVYWGRLTGQQLPESIYFFFLKYKYCICYTSVIQKLEAFDACFNNHF